MTEFLKFVMDVRRLEGIERCSNTPHIHKSYVSSHSYYVALYSMLFADIENSNSDIHIYDTSEVIKKALIHDLEESITGDILFPFKKSNEDYLKPQIQKIVNEELFYGIPNSDIKFYYKFLWNTSKDNSREGIMVAAMDKFEILIYSLAELLLGNKQFILIYETALDILRNKFQTISSLQDILDEIEKEVNDKRLLSVQ
ncbi:MAG: YfbR-like 5'-deoxynucleotidase [archaeon]